MSVDIREKWDDVLAYMRDEFDITDLSFETWLKPLKVYRQTDKELILLAADPMYKNYISKKYLNPMKVAIESVCGCDMELVLITQKDADASETPREEKEDNKVSASVIEKANLNPKYTFSSFVVGKSNQMAHAASVAVAESPGIAYKILYLYGGVGLGKTHLMHAVAQYILKNNPDAKVLYNTSETFINDYVESIQNKRASEFRRKYRDLDVLMIDDIQFIAGKDSTQEEFFHTFNSLYERDKQIIITSDKPPKDIDDIEERLRSRFEGGLIVDIQPPDFETRMAILRKKEEMDHLNIDDEVIKYIADNITSNIRELEGALTRIVAKAKLENLEINLEMARNILKDYIRTDGNKNSITSNLILSVVAEHFGISTADILSQKKNKDIAYPRQIAMYLCCNMTNDSLQQIGKIIGDRDHSTVIHGRDKIIEDINKNDKVRQDINILKKKLTP